MSDSSLKKGRYTTFSNRIGLYSNKTGNYIANTPEVVLNFPFKDTVLEGGMTKEDSGRDERFLHLEIDKKDIDTLEDPKVLTNFKYIDENGETELTADSDIEFFDEKGELKQNLLIKGNNLLALYSLREKLAGKIKLIYIDPPYNTGNDSFKYNDSFNHSSWLTFMQNRLEVARQLLCKNGIIAVQCDYREDAYLKVLMDEVFGPEKYIQTIVVKMSAASGPKMAHSDRSIAKLTESIHIYCMGDLKIYKQPLERKTTWDKRYNTVIDGISEDDGKYLVDIMSRDNVTEEEAKALHKKLENAELLSLGNYVKKHNVETNEEWCFNNAWRIVVRDPNPGLAKRLAELPDYGKQKVGCMLNSRNKVSIYLGTANVPDSILVDLTLAATHLTTNMGNLWDESRMGRSITEEGGVAFPGGKKPENLIGRLIEMFTTNSDIVMDYHLGSGTTSAVAHKLGRRWVAIEQMDYIETKAKKRLKNVISGEQSGISKEVNWQGGGSFVYMELKKYNQEFLDRLMEVTSIPDVEAVYADMQKNAFLKFFFDKKEFEKDENFRSKTWEQRRDMLVEILDENQLYLNLQDMRDSKHKVTNDEMVLTDRFYGVKDDAEE